MGNNGNKKNTNSTNDRDLILKSFRSCVNIDIYQGNRMYNDSWLQVINIHAPTISKVIPNLSQNNFNAAIGTAAGLFDTSNGSGIYRKQFKCECPYNGISWGVWFIYIHPKGGGAPSEPSQASGYEDVYANIVHCYRVERGIMGHVMMTITSSKENQRNPMPTMEFRTSQIFLVFLTGTLKIQPIHLDSIMMMKRM